MLRRRYNYPVNNSRYTNTVASLALAAAVELAPLVGAAVPADWAAKARGLQAPTTPVPAGSNLSGFFHPEYDGCGWTGRARAAFVEWRDALRKGAACRNAAKAGGGGAGTRWRKGRA